MKLKVLIAIALLALASVASGQLIYDEVKVEVAPGVACPSSWMASSEAVTLPAVYRVLVPASIGGRSFRVTARFAQPDMAERCKTRRRRSQRGSW